jgi:hypothetical protein
MIVLQNCLGRTSVVLRDLLTAGASMCTIRRSVGISLIILVGLFIFYIKYASELFQLAPNTKSVESVAVLPEPEVQPIIPLVESKMDQVTPNLKLQTDQSSNQSTAKLLVDEAFHSCDNDAIPVIVKKCQRCTSYEMASKAEYCQKTGLKEAVRCENSREEDVLKATSFWRSCEILGQTETRNFQIFSGFSFASAVVLSGFVYWRHYALAKQTNSRLQQRVDGS